MMPHDLQKALVEALLFVSPHAVNTGQILRKLRKANARWEAAQSGNDDLSNPEVTDATTSVELTDAIDPMSENADAGDLDQLAVESGAVSDNGLEELAEGEETGDDALNQLMGKSRELDEDFGKGDVKALLAEIQAEYQANGRGLELVEVSKGWQIRTRYELATYLRDDASEQMQRLSPSSLETMSIIAYQQPVTRHKIEEIRGVDTGGVLKTLLEKGFVRIVGRSEDPGRPLIYGTTPKFLEVFSLSSLADLPSLKELETLSIETPMGASRGNDNTEDNYFESEELQSTEDLVASGLSSSDSSILAELDASIKELTHVEREIFPQTKETEPTVMPRDDENITSEASENVS